MLTIWQSNLPSELNVLSYSSSRNSAACFWRIYITCWLLIEWVIHICDFCPRKENCFSEISRYSDLQSLLCNQNIRNASHILVLIRILLCKYRLTVYGKKAYGVPNDINYPSIALFGDTIIMYRNHVSRIWFCFLVIKSSVGCGVRRVTFIQQNMLHVMIFMNYNRWRAWVEAPLIPNNNTQRVHRLG